MQQVGIGHVIVIFHVALKAVAFGNHCLKAFDHLFNGRFGFLVVDRKARNIGQCDKVRLQGYAGQLGPQLVGKVIEMTKIWRDIALLTVLCQIEPGKMKGRLRNTGVRFLALGVIDKPLAVRIGRCDDVAYGTN